MTAAGLVRLVIVGLAVCVVGSLAFIALLNRAGSEELGAGGCGDCYFDTMHRSAEGLPGEKKFYWLGRAYSLDSFAVRPNPTNPRYAYVVQYANRNGQGIPLQIVTDFENNATTSHNLFADGRLLLSAVGTHGEKMSVYIGGYDGAPALDESLRRELKARLRPA
jgi:hypothetical protein